MSTSTVPNVSSLTFESMELHPKIMQGIKSNNFDNPTKIQELAIPEVLKGRDLLATAETGSGKTMAFVLPALQKLSIPPTVEGRGPRVLILTPTRELATQITDAIDKMTRFVPVRFGSITGGMPYYQQEQLLRKPFDILIATPGRLMDHMEKDRVDFSRLELFVLDEADRMLDMGFRPDMEHIAKALPKHQTLLFSATLEGTVQKVSRHFLNNPVLIELARNNKPHLLISQRVHLVDNFNHKRALLSHVLEEPGMWQAIVFTGTKRGADELVEDLSEQGINCAALHGDMKQSKRARTLEQMHRGKLKVLIATDVAARGLDVKKLSHVINFDLPRSAEDYVHRIGRTGRCGEKGTAISLVGPKEGHLLAQIERFTGQRLERQTIPGFEPRTSFNSQGSQGSQGSRGSNGGDRARSKSFAKPGSKPGRDGNRTSRFEKPEKGGRPAKRAAQTKVFAKPSQGRFSRKKSETH